MVRNDWVVGGDRREAAVDRIYEAATDLAIRDGIDALDVDTLAALLHCSRATIYRYAGAKAQIRDAVLIRLAAGIIDTVRHAVDGLSGPERIVTAITVALEQIRSDPLRRLMLSAGQSPELNALHLSPVLGHLAADLTGITDDDPQAAQWVVRLVVSFAYWPVANRRIEQQMIKRFVAPAFASSTIRSIDNRH